MKNSKNNTLKSLLHLLILSCFAFNGSTQTILIDSQVWCTKNLDVSVFRNGDTIPQAKTNMEWEKANALNQPAWCYYENKRSNGKKYGKLYNGYALMDPRGLAPAGYHIPSKEEWNHLLAATTDTVESKTVLNNFDFNLTTGGFRYDGGSFNGLGKEAFWWSSTEYYPNSNNAFIVYYNSKTLESEIHGYDWGFYIRCVKD